MSLLLAQRAMHECVPQSGLLTYSLSMSPPRPPNLCRRWQAICAAHAGAVQVLASQMGLQPNRMDIALSMDLRLVVAATPSAALTPDLLAAFDHITRQYWQAASRARGQVAMPVRGRGASACVQAGCSPACLVPPPSPPPPAAVILGVPTEKCGLCF